MKSKELIEGAIKNITKGMVFDYSDLQLPADYTLAAAQAISRMVKAGQLRKVAKGKFYKPNFSRLGEVPPKIEGLMRDLLFKDGGRIGYISGVHAFSQMGLTTQISSKILIASNTYRRPLKRAGYDITYTKQDNIIVDDNVPLLRILDALKFIKKIPATKPDGVIRQLIAILHTLTVAELDMLEDLSKKYPASTRALLGAMMESQLNRDNTLKETLNPFTKYKFGISEKVLPNKLDWNIL